jgi:hypothetical protein
VSRFYLSFGGRSDCRRFRRKRMAGS